MIEVSPLTKPPVARIIDFDKYRYQQEKKLKKQKSGLRKQEVKRIQISIRSAKNDLLIKAKKVEQFLSKGHMVDIVVILRGREKAHRGLAKEKLAGFLQLISAYKIFRETGIDNKSISIRIQAK